MKRARLFASYALLFVLAAVVALRLRSPDSPGDGLPSVDGTGSAGLRALYLYLREQGHDAARLDDTLEVLPTGTRTLVLAAPEARALSEDELDALHRFVERGNTLVYLASSGRRSLQLGLEEWIGLAERPWAIGREKPEWKVWQRAGLLAGLTTLVGSDSSVLPVEDDRGVALLGNVDGPAAWWIPRGKGEIYVFAGTGVAENGTLARADNLAFWERLARRGPMRFDEHHHLPSRPAPASKALWATVLQLALLVAVLFWARGTRLGPARPEPLVRHRSTGEYLDAFGGLLRRARVEPELVRAVRLTLRARLWERASIPTEAPDSEAATLWALRTGEPPERFLRWATESRAAEQAKRIAPSVYLALSREAARLERLASTLRT